MADTITPPTVVPATTPPQPAAPAAATPPVAKPELITEPSDQEVASKVLKTFQDLMTPKEPEKPAEPAKPSDKPAEKTADADDPKDTPVGLSPKATEQFNHIKGSRNEWRDKAKAIEAEKANLVKELEALKAAPKPTVDPAEIEELKKQVKEYDEQLRISNIERHPKFKAHFDTAMNAAAKLAEEAVGKEHTDKIKAILRIPDGDTRNEQLEALSDKLTPLQQGRLAAALVEVQKVERERASELEKARNDYEKIVAHEKAQTEKQTAEQKAKADALLKDSLSLAEKIPAFKPVDGDAEQDGRIKTYNQVVRAFHAGTLPDNMRSAMPVMAMEALHQKTVTIPHLQAELKKRDDIIASYTKAAPSASGGSAAPAKGDTEIPAGEKFMTIFKQNNPANK